MNLWFWLSHPRACLARLRYWWWEYRNPDKPWLTPAAVDFLETHLRPDMTGLEFGSGRSTVWFAGKLRRLTSVEHDPVWFATISRKLADAGLGNVDYRLIPLDHPKSAPEQEVYDPLPKYVAIVADFPDESLDFIVVDGHYRSHCIRQSHCKLKPGGFLLVDDANLWPDTKPPVPTHWLEVSRSSNGLKTTVIWQKPV